MTRGWRTHLTVWAGILAVAGLTAKQARAEGAAATATTLHIGLVNTLFPDVPGPMIQVLAKPFKSLMVDQAGVIATVCGAGDAEHLAVQLKKDQMQLGVFHGHEFAWARLTNPDLKPLMIAVNGPQNVRALLVVRQDNKATTPAQLQGQVLALPRLCREICRLFLERRCVAPHTPLDKCFASVTRPRSPEDALDDVVSGAAQATVVDETEISAYRKAYPKAAAKLKVLAQSELFPSGVIAYQPGCVNEETLIRLRDGMIAAKTTERGRALMDLCRITGFEVPPADYDQMLAEILKAYPPPPAK